MDCCQGRIGGVTVWIGEELQGGNYTGAAKVGTVQYRQGKSPYVFSGIEKTASSVQIRGGLKTVGGPITMQLSLVEVEVYG